MTQGSLGRRAVLQLAGGALAMSGSTAAWAAAKLSAADRLAIQDALARSVWATDTGDADALLRLMTADAVVWDVAGRRWPARAFARHTAGPGFRRGVLHEAQVNQVRARGSAVLVQSYWAEIGWMTDSPGPKPEALGTFADTFARVAGGWRIRERRIGTWDSTTAPVARL